LLDNILWLFAAATTQSVSRCTMYAEDVQCTVPISGAETKTLCLPAVVACAATEWKLAKTDYEFAYEYTYQDHEYIIRTH